VSCRRWVVAYGHAERALAAIRVLEAETAELLRSLPQLDDEQSRWLDEVVAAGSRTLRRVGPHPLEHNMIYETRPA